MLLLSVLWVCWCVMHSLLINVSFLAWVKKAAPGTEKYYRFIYNGLSLVTLVPLVLLTRKMAGEVIFQWQGYGHLVRAAMLCCALILFRGGAKAYDLETLLGIRQYRTGKNQLLLSTSGSFCESGVFTVTRHPWYLGSLLLIWSLPGSYPAATFLAACILSLYLVIGTILEEKKIVAQYGESYLNYSRRVSMLFPNRWLLGLLGGRRKK